MEMKLNSTGPVNPKFARSPSARTQVARLTVPTAASRSPGLLSRLSREIVRLPFQLFLVMLWAQAASAQTNSLSNGGNNGGTISASGANLTNLWRFTANTGDNIVLRLGTTNFAAILNVYGPQGALLSSGIGQDILSTLTATNSGAFTALVTSFDPGGAGAYALRLAQFAQPFVVPATALNNGGDNNGTLGMAGLDRWTFSANAGDNVVLRLGTTNFTGILNLYGPNGALLSSGIGNDVPSMLTATNSGAFIALVTSFAPDGGGAYVLRLAQFAQPFVAPATPLKNGGDNNGTLGVAGLDRWTFTANAGDNLLLRLGTTNFVGFLNVYGPNGALLSTGAGEDVPANFTPTNSGAYTALVTGYSPGSAGAYVLRLAQFAQPFVTLALTLNNGGDNNRTLGLTGLDRWTFTASTGDNVVLRLGTTNFTGILNVYGPNGALLSTGAGGDVPSNFTATNSGTFTALVTGFSPGSTGAYVLRLAQFALPFVAPGFTLTNGGNNNATLGLAGLDRWTFTANAGDNIVLRLGTTNFVAILSVYGPNGALLSTSAGEDVASTFTAASSGAFTALVTGYAPGGDGAYGLRLAHFPALSATPAFTPSNGGYNDATLSFAGVDRWTFTANAGDNVVLRLGTTNFVAILSVYGPNGALLSIGAGQDVPAAFAATNTGAFTALVTSFAPGGAGPYRLRLAHLPGTFVVPAGEAGGSLAGWQSHNGTIDLAAQEMWAFTACAGNSINLALKPTNFIGLFILYGPDGAFLGTGAGTNLASIAVTATNCGTFTVLVTSYGPAGTGPYGLVANGLSDGIKVCPPAVTPPTLTLSGIGGISNAHATFVLYTAANLPTPLGLWTSAYTNQFDPIGVFSYTNRYNPALLQQYFRIVVRP
jgi:putative flippase GtrA